MAMTAGGGGRRGSQPNMKIDSAGHDCVSDVGHYVCGRGGGGSEELQHRGLHRCCPPEAETLGSGEEEEGRRWGWWRRGRKRRGRG